MLKLYSLKYAQLPPQLRAELFRLRKITFKDRLDWQVNCIGEHEWDRYDNPQTHYLLGRLHHQLVCGVRVIDTQNPHMLNGPFAGDFRSCQLPSGRWLEASRFFVYNRGLPRVVVTALSVSTLLLHDLFNYAVTHNYHGIIAIVSRGMYKILPQAGWQLQILEQRQAEAQPVTCLVHLQLTIQSWQRLSARLYKVVPQVLTVIILKLSNLHWGDQLELKPQTNRMFGIDNPQLFDNVTDMKFHGTFFDP